MHPHRCHDLGQWDLYSILDDIAKKASDEVFLFSACLSFMHSIEFTTRFVFTTGV